MKKTKATLHFETLNVEASTVPLFFSIFAQGLRYSLYLIFRQARQQGVILKLGQWLYLSL